MRNESRGALAQSPLARVWARTVSDSLFWVACLLALLYLGQVALRPQGVFWSLDEGGKYLYLQNVLKASDPRAPLEYPGRPIDPHLQFVPLYFWVRQGDQIYSWWPVGFPLLTLPFYQLFGWLGLYVLPAVSGAACAWLSGVMVRQLQPGAGWSAVGAALITGVATPVAFYSSTFWEHAPSVAAFLGALVCVLQAVNTRRAAWLVGAGLLASGATFLRTDVALLMAGLLLALFFWRWRWAVLLGISYALSCVPWLLANVHLMGHPLTRYWIQLAEGPVAGGARDAGLSFIAYALFNAPAVLAYELPGTVLVTGMVALLIAAAGLFHRLGRGLSLLACLALASISGFVLFQQYGYRSVHGFVLIAPHVVFAGWLYLKGRTGSVAWYAQAVVAVSVTYWLAFVARGWVAAGGLQWGPRYMLAFYPLYTVAAIVGLMRHWPHQSRFVRLAIVMAYGLSVMVATGYSVRGAAAQWQTVMAYKQAHRSLVALEAEPLVTGCTWLTMVIPELYWTKTVFAVRAPLGFEAWEAEARRAGVRSGYRVEMDACRHISLDEVARLALANPAGITAERFELLPGH